MKKSLNGVGYNKSRDKMIAKKKAENMAEAKLKARKTSAMKAIVIGSAALGIAALSFFAFKTYKRKKTKTLSFWD